MSEADGITPNVIVDDVLGSRERDRRVDPDPEVADVYTALYSQEPLTLSTSELAAQQERIARMSVQDLTKPEMQAIDPFASLNIDDLEELFKEHLHVGSDYKIPRNPLILKALFGKYIGSFKDPKEKIISYDEVTDIETVNIDLLKELYDLINALSAEIGSYQPIRSSTEFQTFVSSRFGTSLGASFGERIHLDHLVTAKYSDLRLRAVFPHAEVRFIRPLLDNLSYYLLATPFVDSLQNTGTRHMYEDVFHDLYGKLFTYVDRPNPVGQNNIHNLCYTLDQLAIACADPSLIGLLEGTRDHIKRQVKDKNGYRLMDSQAKLKLVESFRHAVQSAVTAIDKKLANNP